MHLEIKQIGDWDKARERLGVKKQRDFLRVMDREMEKNAEKVKDEVVGIYRGVVKISGIPWMQLHPFTIERKGSGTQFYSLGELAMSVKVVKNKDMGYFVGIPKSGGRVNEQGFEYYKIAKMLETGAHIKITDGYRNYLHSIGFHLRKTTDVLVLPARPVWRPIYRKYMRDVKQAFLDIAISEFK